MMIIQGSSSLYPALLAAVLIDELITMTYPVIIGAGKRIFGEGTPVATLTMIDHRVTDQGTVIATYRPGGSLPPYPQQPPIGAMSDREVERQRKMAEGSW